MPNSIETQVAQTRVFVARHGAEVFEAMLEQLDDFLADHHIGTLKDTLAVAPLFGQLRARARKQIANALDGVRENEAVWMILTYDPAQRGPGGFEIRTLVGPCGPIRVSFEDVIGGAL